MDEERPALTGDVAGTDLARRHDEPELRRAARGLQSEHCARVRAEEHALDALPAEPEVPLDPQVVARVRQVGGRLGDEEATASAEADPRCDVDRDGPAVGRP